MAEFRMAEGEKVVVVKIIINFSWIGKYIEYYKKLHFSTHSRRINPISLKRSTKHDILAAILSRGSRLQRDRVAAMNVTRVPLKFFKETVDRVSWRSDVGPPPDFSTGETGKVCLLDGYKRARKRWEKIVWQLVDRNCGPIRRETSLVFLSPLT